MYVDLQEVFDVYREIYCHIFGFLYPAKNSTGFPERNLTVNFSKAYEEVMRKKRQDVISWFEFQFGDKNNKHVDLIILNNSTKELFIVESKRFSDTKKKMGEIGEDIKRIYALKEELSLENSRIPIADLQHVYGVILADVWLESDEKKSIYDSYINKTFLRDYANRLLYGGSLEANYYTQDISADGEWAEKYKLVSLTWELI